LPSGAVCEGGYAFEAPTRFDKLFSGVVVEYPDFEKRDDVRGTEHIGPEDTFDADYGRLLARVYGKGVASPTGKRVRLRAA
jgi:hypothetical protein